MTVNSARLREELEQLLQSSTWVTYPGPTDGVSLLTHVMNSVIHEAPTTDRRPMKTVDIRVLLDDNVNPDDVARAIATGASLDAPDTTTFGATVLVEDEEWNKIAYGETTVKIPSTIFTRDDTVWDGGER